MFNFRVIPILTIDENKLVKTFKFDKKIYVGDPLNTVRIFNNKYVDELIILDISKTRLNLSPNFDKINEICSECFSPITYGGGVKSIDECYKLFEVGVEKIVFNNVLFNNYKFLQDFRRIFGSQSMILSINILKKDNEYYIYDYRKNLITDEKLSRYFETIMKISPGEVLLQSVDKDGSNSGLDFEILKQLENTSNIPIILAGGLNSFNEILKAKNLNIDAVAASSFFTLHGKFNSILISYLNEQQIKKIRE